MLVRATRTDIDIDINCNFLDGNQLKDAKNGHNFF